MKIWGHFEEAYGPLLAVALLAFTADNIRSG
jgi:hypothetical protein